MTDGHDSVNALGHPHPTVLPETPGSISTSLFQRVAELDPEAWCRFVHTYGPAVYYWCQREGIHPNDRADVGQEVFRAVATGIGRFERRPGVAFAAWLRRITRNKAVDHQRRQGRLPVAIGGSTFYRRMASLHDVRRRSHRDIDEDVKDDGSPDAEIDRTSFAIIAQSALANLKPRFAANTWTAFWETAINDRCATDVAEELNMTAMAVRKAKSRVLRCLRDEIGPDSCRR